MRAFVLPIAFAAAVAAVPVQSAPVSLNPLVERDVQCFVLYAIGVNNAVGASDDKAREAGSLGLMYYLGKLEVGAPGVNLTEAVRQEATALQSNPNAKRIGASCDAEFQKRGAELIDLGQKLMATQASASMN